MIGCGTYAWDKTCAVSATGNGEEFVRRCVAYDVSAAMEYGGMALPEAVHNVIQRRMPEHNGGVITVTPQGETCVDLNCSALFRGVCDSTGRLSIGIFRQDEELIA